MITKMSKYSLILLTSELSDFLEKLQDLGMMDITRSTAETDSRSREMLERSTRYKNILSRLKHVDKDFPEPAAGSVPAEIMDEHLLENTEGLFDRIEEIVMKVPVLEREYAASLPWGEFRTEDLDRIRALGLVPHFHIVEEKRFKDSWEEIYPVQRLNLCQGKLYFMTLSQQDEKYSFELKEEKFPARAATAVQQEIDQLTAEKLHCIAILKGLAGKTDLFREYMNRIVSDLDLYLAETSSIKEGEGSISVLEGFSQTEDDPKIRKFLDQSNAFYLHTEARKEDNPPIKLKNNWFSRVFEPIGNLYILPTYGELDLTPFFAPFYMLFFGLCLGDMGYGLILLATGLAVTFGMPKFSAYGKLVSWLGVGAILMPLLSGTFFGLKLADILPMPDSIKSLFFTDMNMFWFSIIFGLFQIVFARMLRAIFAFSNKRWDEGLTEVGWSLIIIWAACAYAGMEMDTVLLPKTVNYILSISGLALILFCSKPSKHFLLRPLMGITSLYDITGIFGDMLSYIRLFGLGLTGGILGLVVNSISMQLTNIPYVGWVLTVIMLIIGHLAVMGLSCLGAFVHPVRLTFVEFYKNAGFIGGGRAFHPLKTYK